MLLHHNKLSQSLEKQIAPSSGSIHTCMSFDSHDQRYLLTSCIDGRVMLHDIYSLLYDAAEEVRVEKLSSRHESFGHMYTATSVQWYPVDNGAFLTSSLDCTVKIWDTNQFLVAGCFKLRDRVFSAKMRSDHLCHHTVAAAVGNGVINLCDLRTSDAEHSLSGPSQSILTLDWCPNEEYLLASGSADGALCLWDVRKGGRRGLLAACDWQQSLKNTSSFNVRAHERAVMSVKFSPCGNFLVSCGNDKKVRCWETYSTSLLPTQYSPCHKSSLPYYISFAKGAGAANDILLFPSSDTIHMVPLHSPTGKSSRTLRGHVSHVSCLLYLQEYHVMLSCGGDGMILIWEREKPVIEESESEFDSETSSVDSERYVPPIVRQMLGENV